jgi:hypothetical protein
VECGQKGSTNASTGVVVGVCRCGMGLERIVQHLEDEGDMYHSKQGTLSGVCVCVNSGYLACTWRLPD